MGFVFFVKMGLFFDHFETMSYCHKGDEQVYNRNIPKSSHTKNQKLLGIRINNKVSLCFFLTERKNKRQYQTRLVKFEQDWTGLNVFGQNQASLNMTSTATANSINGTGNPLAPPLTTDDLEDVLMELNRYEKSPEQKIPNILERFVLFLVYFFDFTNMIIKYKKLIINVSFLYRISAYKQSFLND